MIQRLSLVHFRRYQKATVNFDPGVNFLEGVNNSGKTTLFYAIEYALFGRVAGFRSPADLMQAGKSDMGVQLELVGRDGHLYTLQRVHVRPPRARTSVSGHFTLAVIEGDDRRYVLSSDFDDHERSLALALYRLFGITRALFEVAILTRQGELPDILTGMPRLDQVLGVTAAVVLEKELRAKALDFEKSAGQLPVIKQTLEHELARRNDLMDSHAQHIAELATLEERETRETALLASRQVAEAAYTAAIHRAESWQADSVATLEARLEADRLQRELATWLDANGDETTLKQRATTIPAPAPEELHRLTVERECLTKKTSLAMRVLGDLQGRLDRLELASGQPRCEHCGQPIDTARVATARRDLLAALSENERLYTTLVQQTAANTEAVERLAEQTRTAASHRNDIAERLNALARIRSLLETANAVLPENPQQALSEIEETLAPLGVPLSSEQREPNAVLLTLLKQQAELNARQAESQATLSSMADIRQRIEQQLCEYDAAVSASDREITRLQDVIEYYQSLLRQARRLRRSSSVMKQLQERLRSSATTRLAGEIRSLHATLSGDPKEYREVDVDPKDYRVLVTPAGMRSPVMAATHQGGGHRLMLGLALKLAIANLVGHTSFVLLDEPTDGLDQDHRSVLTSQLTHLGNLSQLLIVSHQTATIEAKHLVVTRNGPKSSVTTLVPHE